MKRLIASLMALMLVVTMFPPGIVKKADAASIATYFLPQVSELRNTAILTTNLKSGDPGYDADKALSRDTAYVTTDGNLEIRGSIQGVSTDSMSARVELLNLNPANGTWTTDVNRYAVSNVAVDPENANRFVARNLTLFSGMNKVTFTGKQGNVQRSDVFYILYDKVPYLEKLKITSGAQLLDLNEGTQVVVSTESVSIQGTAKNATKVTANVDGSTVASANVYDEGDFFTSSFKLKPGKNNINLTITNGTNTINVLREVYYFNNDKPYTSVQLTLASKDYPLYPIANSANPKVTVGTATYNPPSTVQNATLDIELLIPVAASSLPFAGNGSYTIGSTTTVVTTATEIVIPDDNGDPMYRLVSFTTAPFSLEPDGGTYEQKQDINITVNHGTAHSTFASFFTYLPGETAIVDMKYLPKFKVNDDVTTLDIEPLNGATVEDSEFYILVEADKDGVPSDPVAEYALENMIGRLLPAKTTTVQLNLVAANGLEDNQRVYRVSNFPNGQQKVEFKFTKDPSGEHTATFVANISYVSKSYIYISNLIDGQQIEKDSTQTNLTMDITGEFVGFNKAANIGTPQIFINGKNLTDLLKANPYSYDLENDVNGAAATNPDGRKFEIPLTIGDPDDPQLIFGENRITIKGVNELGSSNLQVITKEIKIYIIDTNVSKIANFMPSLSVDTRLELTRANVTGTVDAYTEDELIALFRPSPEFQYLDGKYTTSERKYDLILRGSGASSVNLKLGSESILFVNVPEVAESRRNQGTTYKYDIVGNQSDFIIRVNDIPFPTPGTYVYNLDLINGTGAITSQTLEITREVVPYRILSPIATVGNQIIVNKNFVRFDIEAEGATEVKIGKDGIATKRSDLNNRFVYDYVGLKANTSNKIDIQITRADNTYKTSVFVNYVGEPQVDSQFMEKIGTKHSIFDKALQLTFPKGTVLKAADMESWMAPKLYTDTKLLFGIAYPEDGVVERKNDYGNIIGEDDDERTGLGSGGIANRHAQIIIPDRIKMRYTDNGDMSNFSRISDVYWISGGIGERGNRGETNYKPATNGLPPYSFEGNFTEYEAGRKVVPSNRGKLTISFDSSVVEDISSTITVFRLRTDTDAVWENIGGEVNAKAHTITVPFDEFGYYQVVKLKRSFSDITNHGWARNILNGLYSKGIMNYVRADEFGANDLTTRGEFATLLVKGLNLPINSAGNQTFFDITPESRTRTWDYDHIETAARAGIINGLNEGFFGPDLRITREDAAVMISKALQLKLSVNNSKLEANLAKAFVDSGSINIYARPAVEAVNKAKIMTGSSTTVPGQKKPLVSFNPKGYMTRAEAGKIAIALLQKNTSLFPKNLS